MTFSSVTTRSLYILAALAALMSCRQRNDAATPKVTNGIEVANNEYPNVWYLKFDIENNQVARCTAVFVSPTTAITAAHCAGPATNGIAEARVRPNGPIGSVKAKYWITHPAEEINSLDPDSRNVLDLAVVIYPNAVRPQNVSAYHANIGTASVGDTVTMVGFGISDITEVNYDSSGIKRVGTNVISALEEGLIQIKGLPRDNMAIPKGKNSATGEGDSGGPLFNKNGDLIGITHSGYLDADDMKVSYFVNLSTSASRQLLCWAVRQGAVIPGYTEQSCGHFGSDSCKYKKSKAEGVSVTCL